MLTKITNDMLIETDKINWNLYCMCMVHMDSQASTFVFNKFAKQISFMMNSESDDYILNTYI